MGKMLTSVLVQHGQPWWTGSKCRFLRVTSMPSTVKQAMDQRLVQGMTYIYQEMQLSIITLSSGARTSVTQDRILKHSSREKNILQCVLFTQWLPLRDETNKGRQEERI